MRIIILISFLGLEKQANAQNKLAENQIWGDYDMSYFLSPKLFVGGDMGFRGFISQYGWNQYYIRPTVKFRPKYAYSLSGAMGYFHTNSKATQNLNEFRIHEEIKVKWPDFGVLEMFYRLRLEQRFFCYSGETQNEFNNRLRLLIGMESRDFRWFGRKSQYYFTGTFEGFITREKEKPSEAFDTQFRLDLAIVHRISEAFRYEIHYIAQQSKLLRKNGKEAHQNIFRIRFFHSIIKNFDD